MAILFIHDLAGDTLDHYNEGIKRLEAAGEGQPKGRLFHASAQKGNGYLVVDVWESPEDMERFGQTLMPILEQIGSPVIPPQVYPLHHLIKGKI